MKKTFLSFAISLCFIMPLQAQITINQSDLPSTTATTLYWANDTACTTSPGANGTNINLNLSTLNNHYADSVTYVTGAGLPAITYFPNVNFTEIATDDQTALPYYTCFESTTNHLDILGAYSSTMDVLTFNPPIRDMSFPMTYNTSYTGISSYTMVDHTPSPPIDSTKIRLVWNYSWIVDAWGNVQLSMGTFPCLRKKLTYTYSIDSAFYAIGGVWIWDGNPPMNFPPGTEYTWISNANNCFMAQIDPDPTNPTGRHRLTNGTTGIDDKQIENTLLCFPNPSTGKFIIRSSKPIQEIIVMSITGNIILQSKENKTEAEIDLSSFERGIYLLRVTDERGKSSVQKVILNDK